MKICTKCGNFKQLFDFSNDKTRKDGKFPQCKECKYALDKDYRSKNQDALKQWRKKNKQYIDEYNKVYYENNREYYKNHIRRYNKENREWFRNYENKKRRENINFKLGKNLRNRLLAYVRRGSVKSGSAVRDLGCSIEELKRWLSLKFQDGMNWENYGKEWHIDHVKPLVTFDLTNKEEFLRAFNYTNLQPLWKYENLSKGCKYGE